MEAILKSYQEELREAYSLDKLTHIISNVLKDELN